MSTYENLGRLSRSRRALWIVFLVALLARAAYVVGFGLEDRLTGFSHLNEDERSYEWMADNLIEHGSLGYRGEPSARRGPGYPLFLAAFYSAVGHQYALVRWFQVFLDALTAVLVVLTLRRLGEHLPGLLSGLAYALYPIFIYNSAELLTEALVIPLYVLIAYLMVRFVVSRGRLRVVLGAGMAVGAAFLVRENNILLPIPLAVILWLAVRGSRPQVAWTAPFVFCLGFVLLWSPWVVRNYLTFDELSYAGTTGGENLIRSMNMAVYGLDADNRWTRYRKDHGLVVYHEFHDPRYAGRPFPNEWDSDREAKRLGWAMVAEHPGAFIRFGLQKTWWMLIHADPWRLYSRQPGMRLALAWVYRVLAVIGIVGIWIAWRRGHRVLLAICGTYVAAAFLLLFLMTPFIRYRYVALDLSFIFCSGFALARGLARFCGPTTRSSDDADAS